MKRLALLPSLLLAACGADDGDGQPEYDFTLTAPVATSEILPGGAIDITWEMSGAPEAHLTIDLVPVGDGPSEFTIIDQDIAEGAGGGPWMGFDVDDVLVTPDVFDLVATVLVNGNVADTALRNVSVHGAYFTDPAPDDEITITGSEGERDFVYITVSQRVIELVTSLDPDTAVDGDEIVIDERSIPGEFVPFERFVHFDGLALDDSPVPEGDYTLTLDGSDADDPTLVYRRTGGVVHWRPNL